MRRILSAVFALMLSVQSVAYAAAPSDTVTVTVSPSSGTSFLSTPEQCVDIYTLANGNPACVALFDANDDSGGVNGGPVADSNSTAWLNLQKDSGGDAVALTDVQCPVATQPGGANFGKDTCQSVGYNLNGKSSIATFTGGITYNITCETDIDYSCGHSWSGETLYTSNNYRAQNPTTDHHFDQQNNPCSSSGVSSPVNKPAYTISSGDRCEYDNWNVQEASGVASDGILPATATNGTILTVGGSGMCDEDAPLGGYNCSGSTASNLPLGLDMNPADLVAVIKAYNAGNTHATLPYALVTASNCTENKYEFPSSYYDGYETANGCPPNGFRYWSDITDAQVNATSWSPAKKAIMRTLHHFGGIVDDTTGGYGPGLSVQISGASGMMLNQSSDTTATDPFQWLAATSNGGPGLTSISDNNSDGQSEQGVDISLGSLSPYSVASDFHICHFAGTIETGYSTLASVPKTCGNI